MVPPPQPWFQELFLSPSAIGSISLWRLRGNGDVHLESKVDLRVTVWKGWAQTKLPLLLLGYLGLGSMLRL